MFEHLRDPDPPMPGERERASVGARASKIRRRARAVQSVIAFGAVAVVIMGAVALNQRGTSTIDVLTPPGNCCGAIAGTVQGDGAARNAVTVLLLYPATAPSTTAGTGPGSEPPSSAANPWRVKAQAVTDVDGRYRFADLEPGTYVLRFVDHVDDITGRPRYEPVFSGDAVVFSRADAVEVATGRTTTFDLTMRRSANWGITGSVKVGDAPTALPIANVTVRLFVDGELMREVATNQDGHYDLGGIERGSYTVAFVDERRHFYATRWAADGELITVGDADVIVDGSMVSCPAPLPATPPEGCA